jgi:hypothetical protein
MIEHASNQGLVTVNPTNGGILFSTTLKWHGLSDFLESTQRVN